MPVEMYVWKSIDVIQKSFTRQAAAATQGFGENGRVNFILTPLSVTG